MKGLAMVGLLVFAVSWFLPVHEGLDAVSDLERGMGNLVGAKVEGGLPGGPPGWKAFRLNWDELWKGETWSDAGDEPRKLVWNLTSVTNLLMLAAAFVVFAGGRAARGMGWALIAALALNASWLYLKSDLLPAEMGGGGSVREGLRVGYYAWLASFGLVGAGLLAHRD
jgi:hypothetical protein